MSRPFLLFCASLSLLPLEAGCNSCGSEKPYTPFGVASSLPVEDSPQALSSPSASAAPAPAGSSGFAVRKSLLAPPASKRFELPDRTLEAPPGKSFAQVLPADYASNAKPGALAWLVRDADAPVDAPSGELWYFPNGGTPKAIAPVPGFVPSGPGCTLDVSLAQTGPHSATLDVLGRCQSPLIARAPERGLLVVSPESARPVLVTLRVAPAAPGETLELRADSSDQDQDGRDDVRVNVAVGTAAAGSPEPASAQLVWLDRPAGTSRTSDEPRTSLAAGTSKLSAHARQRHYAQGTERAGNWIRLASTLCAEGGVPRVLDGDGAPFRCGDLTPFVDGLMSALVQGALARSDTLAAFAALARDGWYFAHTSKAARAAIERDLQKASAHVELTEVSVARTVPLVPKAPHYSPLWFENDGALLVRTAAGVTRIAVDGASEQAVDPDAGTPLWPLEVADGAGGKLASVVHACDRSELLVLVNDAAGAPRAPLVTALWAARPASCAGRGSGPLPALAPLGFEGPTPNLLIAGSPTQNGDLKALPALPTLGTARSADGKLLVVPTALGLFVGGERKELWRISKLKEHADPSKLSDCVVQNDAKAIACVESGKILRFVRPAG